MNIVLIILLIAILSFFDNILASQNPRKKLRWFHWIPGIEIFIWIKYNFIDKLLIWI